ncbi:chlorohydrolase [Streptococcus pneumoniae]|nr:chlorohydrolase [Streptococcus pneumoniae]
MKIKEQTRKLVSAAQSIALMFCSKHSFEVADRADVV